MADAALVVVAVADAAADEVVVTFAGVLKVVMAQPGRKRMKTNTNTLAASGERERGRKATRRESSGAVHHEEEEEEEVKRWWRCWS